MANRKTLPSRERDPWLIELWEMRLSSALEDWREHEACGALEAGAPHTNKDLASVAAALLVTQAGARRLPREWVDAGLLHEASEILEQHAALLLDLGPRDHGYPAAWLEAARRWQDEVLDPEIGEEEAGCRALELWTALDDAQLLVAALDELAPGRGAPVFLAWGPCFQLAAEKPHIFLPAGACLTETAEAFAQSLGEELEHTKLLYLPVLDALEDMEALLASGDAGGMRVPE